MSNHQSVVMKHGSALFGQARSMFDRYSKDFFGFSSNRRPNRTDNFIGIPKGRQSDMVIVNANGRVEQTTCTIPNPIS